MASSRIKYIYDLPLFARKELCRVVDESGRWEDLGGNYMNLSVSTLKEIQRNTAVRAMSPTDYLLELLGQKNHTIDYLFVILSKMQHYRAMLTIKDFVDPKLLALLYDGECNLSRIVAEKSAALRRNPELDGKPKQPVSAVRAGSDSPSISARASCQSSFANYGLNLDKSDVKGLPAKSVSTASPPATPPVGSPKVVVPPQSGAQAVTGQREVPAFERQQSTTSSVIDNSLISSTPSQPNERFRVESPFLTPLPPEHCQVPFLEFRQVAEATNNFDKKNELGRGGFGTVFRGTWQNTEVAIKRLEYKMSGGVGGIDEKVVMEQILVEFTSLRRYAHDNILPLYAYSVGGEYPCLIYKLMAKGSLEDRLQCKPLWQRSTPTPPLSWKTRMKIALGVARGLQFLHNVHEKPLIHGDVKSANILLDENFDPKIGDFGLAREGPDKGVTSMVASKIQGTRPYLPPEFLKGAKRSTKLDVYSFGIVLFELATGEKAADSNRPSYRYLGDWVRYHCRKSTVDDIVDIKISTATDREVTVFRQLIQLGIRCTNDDPKLRPEMKVVYEELWRQIEALEDNRQISDHEECSESEDEDSDISTEYSQSHRLSVPSASTSRVNLGLPLLSYLLAPQDAATSSNQARASSPPLPDFSALGISPDVDTVKLGEALRPLFLLSQEDSPTARAVTALLPAITALFSNRSLSASPLLSNEKSSRSRKSSSDFPRDQASNLLPALSAFQHGKSELISQQLPDLAIFKESRSSSVQITASKVELPDVSALRLSGSDSVGLPDFGALNVASNSDFVPIPNAVENIDDTISSAYASSMLSSEHSSDSDDDIVVAPTAWKKKLAI